MNVSAVPARSLSVSKTAASSVSAAPLDGLMVYDGVCNFCSGYVRLVLAIDRKAVIRFTCIQSPYGRLLCEANGVEPDDPSTFLFFDKGRALEATDAMAAMLRRLPPPWRWLAILAIVPQPIRDRSYRWIARNRYRLLGKRKTCMIPSPEVRVRFIETSPDDLGKPDERRI